MAKINPKLLILLLAVLFAGGALAGCSGWEVGSKVFGFEIDSAKGLGDDLPKEPKDSPHCDGTAAKEHAGALKLAEQYDVAYDEVIQWFCQGYGYGEIKLAYKLSAANKSVSAAKLFSMRAKGMGWGEIKAQYKSKDKAKPSGDEDDGQGVDKPKKTKKPKEGQESEEVITTEEPQKTKKPKKTAAVQETEAPQETEEPIETEEPKKTEELKPTKTKTK